MSQCVRSAGPPGATGEGLRSPVFFEFTGGSKQSPRTPERGSRDGSRCEVRCRLQRASLGKKWTMADCRRGEFRRWRPRADCHRMAWRDVGSMQAARDRCGCRVGRCRPHGGRWRPNVAGCSLPPSPLVQNWLDAVCNSSEVLQCLCATAVFSRRCVPAS